MGKPLFQDIIPPERRSIKKITKSVPLPQPRYEAEPPVRSYEPRNHESRESEPIRIRRYAEEEQLPPPPSPTYRKDPFENEPEEHFPLRRTSQKRSGMRWPRLVITLVAVLIILGVGFWFISRVSGAWIVVTPKQETVSVNAAFAATKGAIATSSLQFQTVTIAKDGKLGIAATGQEVANTKASGTIIIYNTTSAAQRLIATTRFETPKGLIFRISQPVTIPAKSGDTPGSIEAVVTADAVGPDYNVGLSDFTVPGFKGDPKYTQIYARTKIAMQGGFSGTRKKVNDADKKTAQEKVRNELKNNLVREAEKDIPSGFVLPKNSYFIEYESLADTNTDSGIQINERATFHGVIFNRTTLAQEISKKVNGKTEGEADISGIENLSFTLKTSSSTRPWNDNGLTFNLTGTTTLVSVIDNDKLTAELVGKPRKSLNAILAGYPGITNAEVTMRPFWKSTFPVTKDEIFITIQTLNQ